MNRPRTAREWEAWASALQVQTVRQANRIHELMEANDDLSRRLAESHEALTESLIQQEEQGRQLGMTLGELSYWQQRAYGAERGLPGRQRLHLVSVDGGAG